MAVVQDILLNVKSKLTGFNEVKSGFNRMLGDARGGLRNLNSEFEKTLSGFNRAVLGIRTGIFQTAAGFILGAVIQDTTRRVVEFGRSFIQVNSDIQQFKLQFENIFRSAGNTAEEAGKKAENAFAFAKRVAIQTPFDLPDITQAILRFQIFGLEVDKFLQNTIDLAAATGKELGEVAQAFTNIQSRRFGEAFEQFARFGIARDLLEGEGLVFDRNGSYQGSVNEAMTAINNIIEERFGGFAESQQGTFKQLQSNLADIIFQFKEAFGGAIFAGVNEDLAGLVTTLETNNTTISGYLIAFGELFEGARQEVSRNVRGIADDLARGIGTDTDDFFTFGVNLFVAFAEGMLEGGKFVLEAASAVASIVGRFFESFSPPKEGPLKEIDVWGANVMNAFIDGMAEADFGRLESILSLVKDQFDAFVSSGLIDTSTPEQDFLQLVDIIVNGFDDIVVGGEDAAAIFEQIGDAMGVSASQIEEWVAATDAAAEATSRLADARSEFEDLQRANDDRTRAISRELEDLRVADRKRRDEFNAAQRAADRAAREVQDTSGGGEQDDTAKFGLEDQIANLRKLRDAARDQAKAAIDLIDQQKDNALKLIQVAVDAANEASKQASRALEDFNFETEGIPERFTRQRRRELERIATIRKREAEDARDAARDESDRIREQYDLQKRLIEQNRDIQLDSYDAQIDSLQEQLRELRRIESAERSVNNARADRPEFVPDPRIEELEELLRLEERRIEDEEQAARDRIKIIEDEVDALDAVVDKIEEQFSAQELLAKFVEDALKEQQRILAEIAKDQDTNFSDTTRHLGDIAEQVNQIDAAAEKAREKLRDLIPQSTRDDIKNDLKFFTEFFKGVANIGGPITPTVEMEPFEADELTEGFRAGAALREGMIEIGRGINEIIIPGLEVMFDTAKKFFEVLNDIVDLFDRLKAPLANKFRELGFDKIADWLDVPTADRLIQVSTALVLLGQLKVASIALRLSVSVIGATFAGLMTLLSAIGLLGGGGGNQQYNPYGPPPAPSKLATIRARIVLAASKLFTVAAAGLSYIGAAISIPVVLSVGAGIAGIAGGALLVANALGFDTNKIDGGISDTINNYIINARAKLTGTTESPFNTLLRSILGEELTGLEQFAKKFTDSLVAGITTDEGQQRLNEAVKAVVDIAVESGLTGESRPERFVQFMVQLAKDLGLNVDDPQVISTLASMADRLYQQILTDNGVAGQSYAPTWWEELTTAIVTNQPAGSLVEIPYNEAIQLGLAEGPLAPPGVIDDTKVKIKKEVYSTASVSEILGITAPIEEFIPAGAADAFKRIALEQLQQKVKTSELVEVESDDDLSRGNIVSKLISFVSGLRGLLGGPLVSKIKFAEFVDEAGATEDGERIATTFGEGINSEKSKKTMKDAVDNLLKSSIVPYIRGQSPPPLGPLSTIDKDGENLANTLALGFEAGIQFFAERLEMILEPIKVRVQTFFSSDFGLATFLTSIATTLGTFTTNIGTLAGELTTSLGGIVPGIATSFGNVAQNFFDIGFNITDGLARGITAGAENLNTAVEFLITIINKIPKAFKENSPSLVFIEHGKNIVKGFAIGLSDTGVLEKSVDQIISTVGDVNPETSQFDKFGALSARAFYDSFDREVQALATRNQLGLQANFNTITVYVNEERSSQQETNNPSEAANAISKILLGST